jgi:hypothetical protein
VSETPTFAQAIRSAIENRLVDLHTAMPGQVVSYSATTRRASVQPLLKRGVVNERGERVAETLPVINEVPILFFGGLGGTRLRLDLRKGDTVLLVFSEGSIDRWLHKGGLVDPEDDRHHSLSDAFAFPFSLEDSGPEILFTETEIHAGGDQALALLSDLQALRSDYNTHVHSGVTTGVGSSGVPATLTDPPVGTAVLKGG